MLHFDSTAAAIQVLSCADLRHSAPELLLLLHETAPFRSPAPRPSAELLEVGLGLVLTDSHKLLRLRHDLIGSFDVYTLGSVAHSPRLPCVNPKQMHGSCKCRPSASTLTC